MLASQLDPKAESEDMLACVQILYGNLAPGGSVAKITGKEGFQFSGPAAVFDRAPRRCMRVEIQPSFAHDPTRRTVGDPADTTPCAEEEAMLAALTKDPEAMRGKVIVIRYEGPKGGPGMPEMLTPTSAIMGAGLGQECALITDGRFSGGSHGFVIGHICPEAQEGGPIGLVQDGDVISIDAKERTMNVRRPALHLPQSCQACCC